MSDDLRQVLDPLRKDAAGVRWESPEAVRRRGRQRARNRAAIVGAAAATVVALSGAAVWQTITSPVVRPVTPPGATATPAASAPTTPAASASTTIAADALLAPAELGPDYAEFEVDDKTQVDERGSLLRRLVTCAQSEANPRVPGEALVAMRMRTLQDSRSASFVTQTITQYRDTVAARRLVELRTAVAACEPALDDRTPESGMDTGLLVEEASGSGVQFHAVMVRGGTEIQVHVAGDAIDAAEAWRVATVATDRACAAISC